MAERNASTVAGDHLQQLTETAKLVLCLLGERDSRLREHSERVANASANFAENCGILRGDDLHHLYLAGLLHDTGYIADPAEVLDLSPAPTEEERLLVKRHPAAGVNILSTYAGFGTLLAAIRHHHEAFDGSGYPDGKKGEEIPLVARILHLFDHYDKLTSGGRRGKGLSREEALADSKRTR
jgi:HD-GYP domain-containing protein (c-di-GMP phosphodiesterase class II)